MKTFFFSCSVKPLNAFAFLVLFFGLSVDAHAWGRLGHQAICDAVWRNSSSMVKSELSSLAKRMGERTFADACVLADRLRNDDKFSWTGPLHYINVSRRTKSVNNSECLSARRSKPKCVVTAINYYRDIIKNTSSQYERDFALVMFAHFLGDIHQPLHVSYKDDRGGTRQNVIFDGKLLSLHRLWDAEIISCGYRGSWQKLGKSLARQSKRYKADQTSAVDWANESLTLTRLIYQQNLSRLPTDYCQQFHPVALERLKLASGRLAVELAGLLGQ